MDEFAALFAAIVISTSGLSILALAGFMIWDSIADRRLGAASLRRVPAAGLASGARLAAAAI